MSNIASLSPKQYCDDMNHIRLAVFDMVYSIKNPGETLSEERLKQPIELYCPQGIAAIPKAPGVQLTAKEIATANLFGIINWKNVGRVPLRYATPLELEMHLAYIYGKASTETKRQILNYIGMVRGKQLRESNDFHRAIGTEEEGQLQRGREAFKKAICEDSISNAELAMKKYLGRRVLSLFRKDELTAAEQEEHALMKNIIANIGPSAANRFCNTVNNGGYDPSEPGGGQAYGLAAAPKARQIQVTKAQRLISYVLQKEREAQAECLLKYLYTPGNKCDAPTRNGLVHDGLYYNASITDANGRVFNFRFPKDLYTLKATWNAAQPLPDQQTELLSIAQGLKTSIDAADAAAAAAAGAAGLPPPESFWEQYQKKDDLTLKGGRKPKRSARGSARRSVRRSGGRRSARRHSARRSMAKRR